MKKNDKNMVLDILGIIWTSIFIGSYIFYPTGVVFLKGVFEPVQNVMCIPGILYLILRKIFTKEKVIITSKLDVLLGFFFFTMIIPVLTNTYISMYESISYVLFYFTILVFYCVIKNICKNSNNKYILLNIVLIFVVLVMLYGIDIKAFDVVNKTMGFTLKAESSEHSIYSFHYIYHNELALVMLVGTLISQYMLNKRNKTIYQISLLMSMIGMFLAMSRIAIFLFLFFEFIYFIISQKKKELSFNCIISLIISVLLAVSYSKIYDNSEGIKVLLFFVAFLVLQIGNFRLIYMINFSFLSNFIKKKRIVFIFVILTMIIIVVMFTIISLFTYKLEIKNSNFDEYSKFFFKFKNIKYNQINEIEINYSFKDDSPFQNCLIILSGVNENGKYEDLTSIVLQNDSNKVVSNIYIGNYKQVKYRIFGLDNYPNKQIRFESIKVNGKEELIKYGIIPLDIQYFIDTIDFNNVSVNERINLYKDVFKMSKEYSFVGLGSNAWKCIFESMQSINYYATEIHSRVLEILVSYGIVGLIVYILLTSYIIKNIPKFLTIDSIFIFAALSIIYIQSTIDFVLSEYPVIVLFYFLLGILTSDLKDVHKGKWLDTVTLAIFTIISIYICGNYAVTQSDMKEINIFNFFDKFAINTKYERIIRGTSYSEKKIYMENILKFEKYDNNYSVLNNYLQMVKDGLIEPDYMLVNNTLDIVRSKNTFNLEDISNYIYNLISIKKSIAKIPELSEKVGLIDEKITQEILNLDKKMEDYKYWPMELEGTKYITEEIYSEAISRINNLKKYIEDEGIKWKIES